MSKRSRNRRRDDALTRVIAVVNDKGGVGKTSVAANLAGQFAGAGYRCLLIDLNRQANLADDLGFRGSDVDDRGAGLLGSVIAGTPLTPAVDVRPGLDVVCGGARLEDLTPVMVSRLQHHGREAFRVLGDVLAPVAVDYELVFVDCPPESTILTDLALAAARWVLMPTRSDVGGLVGMTLVADRFALAREINARLRLLGVVLFGTGTRSTAVHGEVRSAVEKAFGGNSPWFETTIRHAERSAQDARRLGKLAHELEIAAAAQPAWWEALRMDITAPRLSPTAAGVAGDYRALGVEVLTALQSAEENERDDDRRGAAGPA
ncbi:cellulose biosynthesis protein BcsQ [Pseudonocardia sediminis]|uniref:Cellulose biosynthesis protein BcsQ n=1 Tax=Pseudonocardia sediminis TaxID=1397368 RepID=A0A4Q7V0N3_PSEST|nr:ParA family protein [Pseudonocardia sediminis]RZT86871.1 cellulose biosynthesis protein BcsQ [Pseudonocardia sediminis]